uniref:Uncharacterized protein n=1 Tax=Anas platyrhynchos platyrhynchos TaxID=8840 RepID=A0A493TWX0_ANAPP
MSASGDGRHLKGRSCILHGLLPFLYCSCAVCCNSSLFSLPSAESPPERCGQRRSMPSGVPEKNPTMEPAATTPFRVTVSASSQPSDPCRVLPEGRGPDPMLHNPFSKEISPNIQPKSPLAQLEIQPWNCVTWFGGE